MKILEPWNLPLGGTKLIEASAGTGKTFTLTTLYLRLIVEANLLPSQILVVTYTQAATAELRERVRGRLREAIEIADPPGPVPADEDARAGDRRRDDRNAC